MDISLILAHPDPLSFNHAIAKSAFDALVSGGHSVQFHDLYLEGFDSILPSCEIPDEATIPKWLDLHCDEIASAQGIVIVHPNWWGQPPAILKGWIDRVLRPDIAYKFLEGDGGEGIPLGLLSARAAVVFNTSNTKPQRELEVFKDPLETIWRNCIFGLCGVSNFYRKTYSPIVTSSLEQRQAWLLDVKNVMKTAFGSGYKNPLNTNINTNR